MSRVGSGHPDTIRPARSNLAREHAMKISAFFDRDADFGRCTLSGHARTVFMIA